jgi:hypothetical protein
MVDWTCTGPGRNKANSRRRQPGRSVAGRAGGGPPPGPIVRHRLDAPPRETNPILRLRIADYARQTQFRRVAMGLAVKQTQFAPAGWAGEVLPAPAAPNKPNCPKRSTEPVSAVAAVESLIIPVFHHSNLTPIVRNKPNSRRRRVGRGNSPFVAGDGVSVREIQTASLGGLMGCRSGPTALKTRFWGPCRVCVRFGSLSWRP